MSGVVERITEVLREHYPVFDERGHINGTVPGRGSWHCWCDMVVDAAKAEVDAHVAAALQAALELTEELKVPGVVDPSTSRSSAPFRDSLVAFPERRHPVSTNPFGVPYTLRERWALFKARRVIKRCHNGKHCYRCGCWDADPPSMVLNNILWNGACPAFGCGRDKGHEGDHSHGLLSVQLENQHRKNAASGDTP